MTVYETDEIIERVILVGVAFDTDDDTERSLDELGELAKTAGAQTVGRMIQTRDNFHPATYIGKGKIEELRLMIDELDATGIICDDELSPAQFKNLEDELGVKVMDRTMVILDIFAARATSSEGKIQVEMAQLKYRSIRLAGFGTSMSRLGGGIGTRGPGQNRRPDTGPPPDGLYGQRRASRRHRGGAGIRRTPQRDERLAENHLSGGRIGKTAPGSGPKN